MFDNNQTTSQNVDIPTGNKVKCAYCECDCVQLDSAWPTFICVHCGGKCILKCREKEDVVDDCNSWIIWDVESVEWTQTKFTKKL